MNKKLAFSMMIVSMLMFSEYIAFAGVPDENSAGAAGMSSNSAASVQRLDSGISINLGGGVYIDMVKISAGSYTMGSDLDNFMKHRVNITKDFYIGKTEVTVAQWKKVLYTDPSFFKAGDNYPVEQVSWMECCKFIERLNMLNQVYGTFRMPTEAEWEYACRAGTATDYYFGTAPIGNYCWYFDNSAKATHPVAQKLPNAWGLYDMGGNVWEWCDDWWKPAFTADEDTDPVNLYPGIHRVFRGGAWNSYNNPGASRNTSGYFNGHWCCKSFSRGGSDPNYNYPFVGLRLALTPVSQ